MAKRPNTTHVFTEISRLIAWSRWVTEVEYRIWNYTQDPETVLQDHYQELALSLNFSNILFPFLI